VHSRLVTCVTKHAWWGSHVPRAATATTFPRGGSLQSWPDGGGRVVWKVRGEWTRLCGGSIAEGLNLHDGDFGATNSCWLLTSNGRLKLEDAMASWKGAQPGSAHHHRPTTRLSFINECPAG